MVIGGMMLEPDPLESEFEQFLRQLPFDDLPRAEHRDALLERALQRFDQAREAPVRGRVSIISLHNWKQLWRHPRAKAIAASILCLSILASWLIVLAVRPYGFDHFASELLDAKSARLNLEFKVDGEMIQQGEVLYLAPNLALREISMFDQAGLMVSDGDSGKVITVIPNLKQALVATPPPRPPGQSPSDPYFRLKDVLARSRSGKEKPFEPIGQQQIAGQPAVGFRMVNADGVFAIWGNPHTGRLLRAEAAWNASPTIEAVISDFQANAEVDQSKFNMTPPAGYNVQSMQIDFWNLKK